MHALIAWSGFVGSWLLVGGPMFQAAVELGEQEHQRRGLGRKTAAVGRGPRLSPWWWLLPPVAYVLQRRRQRAYRQAVFEALTRDEVESFVDYSNVATGWAMVAAGAFFIGIKETDDLVEEHGWPLWALPATVVVMVVLCALYTVVRTRTAQRMVDEAAGPTPTPTVSAL